MNEAEEKLLTEALRALDTPNNEPLRWLMEAAFREQTAWPQYPNFLLTSLSQPRKNHLVMWNAWIEEFRKNLLNPEAAPPKVQDDLRGKGAEIEDKLRGVAAEIHAVIELGNRGFSEFLVVAPSPSKQLPDFEAKFDGRRARIEVKNLREPDDHLRPIAADEWSKQRQRKPERYTFNARLRHSNRGTLSRPAELRLRNIIAQFPDMNSPVIEVLDGGVEIRLERIGDLGNSPEAWMHKQILKDADVGRIVIVSTMLEQHLDFNLSEMQALFLKALRVVTGAQTKFFSKETLNPNVVNVIAMRWGHPEIFYDPNVIEQTEKRIEQLYADFDLPLKVIIFGGNWPEMPWATLNRYK
jgi:hypothetical protein